MNQASSKITADHLRRDAYLYVRQSSLHQVLENTESTKRQYGLRQRAVALGWPADNVVTIDQDLGQSAAGSADRAGFQRLVGEVGMGKVGIVLGLEVSRLARSSSDWHRLLEICALSRTLILDEDGVYDPTHYNDRLLLGLKGTMSEAELHILRARLTGGIISKAERGELRLPLPTGLVYDEVGRVVRDPDTRVRETVELLFAVFQRTGSATATVRHFGQEGLPFPLRIRSGPQKGQLVFTPLLHSRVLRVLWNPRYAGAFVFGRTRMLPTAEGAIRQTRLPRDEWRVLIRDAHEAYISWGQHEQNLRRLSENATAYGSDRCKSPPREGPALLQGIAICGRCGNRMSVAYRQRGDTTVPVYRCQRQGIEHSKPACQTIPGADLDEAISQILIEAVTPLSLEVALSVESEIRARTEEVDRLRRQEVERARYEAELAERRYRRVDPDNRLVIAALEADWNTKLRQQAEALEAYETQRKKDAQCLDDRRRKEIMSLVSDFPRLWNDPRTPTRDKKRMVRLIIEDVTLLRDGRVAAHVRFRGGATRTLSIRRPLRGRELRRTAPQIVRLVDQLLDEHTDAEAAEILNAEGHTTGVGRRFDAKAVAHIRFTNGLRDRYDRLRARGLLTEREMASDLNVTTHTVKIWRAAGLVEAHRFSERNQFLYVPPGPDRPRKWARKGIYGPNREAIGCEATHRGVV